MRVLSAILLTALSKRNNIYRLTYLPEDMGYLVLVHNINFNYELNDQTDEQS